MKGFSVLFLLFFIISCSGNKESINRGVKEESPIKNNEVSKERETISLPQEGEKRECFIYKDLFDQVVAYGPGRFLGRLSLEAVKEGGKFLGFKIVRFKDRSLVNPWILEGDIIVSVNGKGIERPDDLWNLWKNFSKVESLRFEVIREGSRKIITCNIIRR